MRQYDSLVQMVSNGAAKTAGWYLTITHQIISYSTAQITERLDQGRKVAEQFTKIGMFLAALAGIVAPMSLLTGFYGMNVQELTSSANASLFGFWQIGIPVLMVTAICIAFIVLWMMTDSQPSYRKR